MELSTFFQIHPKTALAFSGGADSSYLLYAAKKYGAEIKAYYVKSEFQPQFELDDALHLAKDLSADMQILKAHVLESENVAANPANRCYFCKKIIFETILETAEKDGFSVLLDGTNASDDADDRPGMRALKELRVLSPLRECGLDKKEIRRLSREAGLFTWDKPAYACLATRISAGDQITEEKLQMTEAAENYLFSLGFTDFRVRFAGSAAKLQLPAGQLCDVMKKREKIIAELRKYYSAVLLDLEGRT